jgi:hypothetical protein
MHAHAHALAAQLALFRVSTATRTTALIRLPHPPLHLQNSKHDQLDILEASAGRTAECGGADGAAQQLCDGGINTKWAEQDDGGTCNGKAYKGIWRGGARAGSALALSSTATSTAFPVLGLDESLALGESSMDSQARALVRYAHARTDIGGRRIWRAHPMAELCGHGVVGTVGFSKPSFHALPPPTLIPLGASTVARAHECTWDLWCSNTDTHACSWHSNAYVHTKRVEADRWCGHLHAPDQEAANESLHNRWLAGTRRSVPNGTVCINAFYPSVPSSLPAPSKF